jgi:soluble cytochrome b562
MIGSGIVGGLGPAVGPLFKAASAVPFVGPYVGRAAEAAGGYFKKIDTRKIEKEAGKQIEKLSNSLQVPLSTLASTIQKVDKRLPQDLQDEFRKLLFAGKPRPGVVPKGTLVPGKDVQELRKEAGRISRGVRENKAATSKEMREGLGYEKLIGQLDDAVISAAPPKVAKALEKARAQYRTGQRPWSPIEVIRQGIPQAFWQTLFAPAPKKPEKPKKKEI